MRTLWNVVSFLAVVHLLALLMLAGWLWHSRRLDGGRLLEIRALLAEPVSADEAADDAANVSLQGADAPDPSAAVPSAARVELASMLDEQIKQSVRWLGDEKRLLTEQLALATAQIERQEQEFADRRDRWEQSIEAERQRRVDEQFAKVVRQLESVPAKQGRQLLANLVAENRIEQAVAYLDAMNPRAAAKILREFKSEPESRLATELLERLRTFGLDPEAATDASDDANAANTAS